MSISVEEWAQWTQGPLAPLPPCTAPLWLPSPRPLGCHLPTQVLQVWNNQPPSPSALMQLLRSSKALDWTCPQPAGDSEESLTLRSTFLICGAEEAHPGVGKPSLHGQGPPRGDCLQSSGYGQPQEHAGAVLTGCPAPRPRGKNEPGSG